MKLSKKQLKQALDNKYNFILVPIPFAIISLLFVLFMSWYSRNFTFIYTWLLITIAAIIITVITLILTTAAEQELCSFCLEPLGLWYQINQIRYQDRGKDCVWAHTFHIPKKDLRKWRKTQ